MQKIQLLENYSITDGKVYSKGETIIVSNNVAHGLIEQGIAVLFSSYQAIEKENQEKIMKPPKDKMMRTEDKKYKTK